MNDKKRDNLLNEDEEIDEEIEINGKNLKSGGFKFKLRRHNEKFFEDKKFRNKLQKLEIDISKYI